MGSFLEVSAMQRYRKAPKGFTLIEILIVVIILGILAAIVIPQFSSASNDARKSSLASTAQTMRSQIALYRLQHNDTLPGTGASGFVSATFWTQMTTKTDAQGVAYVAASSLSGPFGPYMQTIPVNPLAASQAWQSTVTDGTLASTVSATGFVYDYTGGTGNFWGTDATGAVILP
jgi:general secretion pathway protein G